MQAAGDVVFTEVAEEIRDGPGADAKRLGFILVRSTVAGNPQGAVGLLIGPDATFLLGNQSGDVWTDLAHLVPAPPVDLTHNGAATYTGPDGVTRMGALAVVRETPFAVWVEFPRAAVVAPALTFLRSITIVGLLLIVGGSFVIRSVTRRMTTPLVQLTDAAESIAAGDYARRAPGTTRRDEIGRLSGAFNVMAEHVQIDSRRPRDARAGANRSTGRTPVCGSRARRKRTRISLDVRRRAAWHRTSQR